MIDLQRIPRSPGCYLFKDSRGKILYVGKAKDLRKRVSSYFQKKHDDEKTRQLVSHIVSVDFFVTDSEVEALILENNLIKKHWPKYNISLKDSRRYAYIELTNEEFPRLLIARKREAKGVYFGPFVSAAVRDYIREALIKMFKIRTCKRLPKRVCLRQAIGLCSAPCVDAISKSEYSKNVSYAKMVLRGETALLIEKLEEKMRQDSTHQNYEGALEARNQIEALSYLEQKQKVERTKAYDEDIINYVRVKDTVHLLLFNTRKGILENKQDFELAYSKEFLREFITQYYSEAEIPRRIVVPEEVDDVVAKYLSRVRGSRVDVVVPQKGAMKELLELVRKNVEITLFGDFDKIEDLMKALKLNELPRIIECFDISHLSGTQTVASMVQFRNGKPDKTNYRKYKLRTVDGIDDFASMKEVIRRRYTKLKMNKETMPHLVVIDGGKGQLSAALEVLEELDIKLVVISIAKREEEIFIPGRKTPIVLDKKRKALKLIQTLRDEAHRFAITYNRLLRKKALVK